MELVLIWRTPRAIRHRLVHIICAAGASAAVISAHSGTSTAAPTTTITVKDDAFSAKRATVARSTLVTWRWASESGDHDVVSRGAKRFRSSDIRSSGVHRYRFTKTGTYRYVCSLHEDDGMTGQITVR